MQKTIVAAAFAIAVATTASFAAGEAKMKITSSAFQEGGDIPSKFSRDGGNVNPPLRVEGRPANAKSLVLIVDDPDARSVFLRIGWFGISIPRQLRSPRKAYQKEPWRALMIIQILVMAGHNHPQAPIVITSKSSRSIKHSIFAPVQSDWNSTKL